MNAGKSAHNHRSAEQMLVELKQRLREISDLNAAADVLSWDQATYMPEGGASARGRQRAMLCRLAPRSQGRERLRGGAVRGSECAFGKSAWIEEVFS